MRKGLPMQLMSLKSNVAGIPPATFQVLLDLNRFLKRKDGFPILFVIDIILADF